MHERVRCSDRLKPVDIPQVAESDLGGLPSVPFAVHSDQRVVLSLHGSSPVPVVPQVDLTEGSFSHPLEGG